MCQPGRPGPHGLSHAGSPGLELFQRAKSPGFRFGGGLDAGACHQLFGIAVAELAVVGVTGHVEVDVAPRRVGKPLVDQPRDDLDDLGDVLGGAGHLGRSASPE